MGRVVSDNPVPEGITEKRAVVGGLLSFVGNKEGACEARPSLYTESIDRDNIINMTEETRRCSSLGQTGASSPSAW